MKEYKSKPNVDKTVYESLVSSVTRIKVWTYKTIGEIYGKAIWFDDPITKVSAIRDSTNYQVLDMAQLVDKCLDVMDNGVDGVPANKTIDWIAWLDPQNVSSVANSQYRKWNWMVPPYEVSSPSSVCGKVLTSMPPVLMPRPTTSVLPTSSSRRSTCTSTMRTTPATHLTTSRVPPHRDTTRASGTGSSRTRLRLSALSSTTIPTTRQTRS